VERGRARADARAVGVGDGDGDCGVREAAEAPGARELAVVKRGLPGAGGREHDGVPGRHARRVASREPQPAPGLAQCRRRLPRCVGPPPGPVARRRLHRSPSQIGQVVGCLVSPLRCCLVHRCSVPWSNRTPSFLFFLVIIIDFFIIFNCLFY
jgi:hypothetical protein